jgi:16S rRNA processing protein RimM
LNNLSNSKFIPIGKVVKPHGIKGELKFFLYNKDSNLLSVNVNIWFKINNSFKSFDLLNLKGLGKIFRLDSVNNRNDAESLRDKEFFVLRDDLPVLDDGNFYLNDIINFKLFNVKEEIGLILDVLLLPSANYILVNYNNREILIPVLEKYIKFFDFDEKIVIMKNIEGFLNL